MLCSSSSGDVAHVEALRELARELREPQPLVGRADPGHLRPGACQQLLLLGLHDERAEPGGDPRARVGVELVKPGRCRRRRGRAARPRPPASARTAAARARCRRRWCARPARSVKPCASTDGQSATCVPTGISADSGWTTCQFGGAAPGGLTARSRCHTCGGSAATGWQLGRQRREVARPRRSGSSSCSRRAARSRLCPACQAGASRSAVRRPAGRARVSRPRSNVGTRYALVARQRVQLPRAQHAGQQPRRVLRRAARRQRRRRSRSRAASGVPRIWACAHAHACDRSGRAVRAGDGDCWRAGARARPASADSTSPSSSAIRHSHGTSRSPAVA